MFTGDASGDWLFRALHAAGFASQAVAIDRHDGLVLHDAFITAAGRCAPPKNKPTPAQLANCFPFLVDEIGTLAHIRVIVTLGKIADDTIHAYVKAHGRYRTPRQPFAHGRENLIALPSHGDVTVIASYHPSRQNTNTGVLTKPMLDAIFTRARELTTPITA
jgi:uracil-DNA glycosylase family 4